MYTLSDILGFNASGYHGCLDYKIHIFLLSGHHLQFITLANSMVLFLWFVTQGIHFVLYICYFGILCICESFMII